ncbi:MULTISPECIES: hypothetical protein [Streptomyces]|uniref:DUF1876 domain-containing protein n=1 Tax=Streptomyces evansiae TaxID=3075535 RepID=A0ABU2QZE0_9ACTN|nr:MULTISPECIES: hypothetical protein [unclassified Streptomyces]MDT0409827.1 hypothetical protein [Streptomyces sp. DSM 41979]MYQ60112.1 hypothetical protein [Streptomyces sp. SID4926]SCE59649.1 hypothetical protein GA0115252_176630 [Streptomyces sp. DfronAA-171]
MTDAEDFRRLGPRLLPWTGTDGKDCWLSSDGQGYVARVADQAESVLLGMGAEVMSYARPLLENPATGETELRFAGRRLSECLADALRVARSRGLRLSSDESEEGPEDSCTLLS